MNLSKTTVIYITREIERALGTAPNANYQIVTNRNPYSESVQKQFPEWVTLIDGEILGTGDLMKHPATEKLVAKITEATGVAPFILVFKNTARIEPLAKERGWQLLNPSEAISEKIENKVSQIAWLGDLAKFLPTFRIEYTKNLTWGGKPYIVQWAHGHTGGGTILIQSDADLATLKGKFPERRCRVTEYVEGPSFTVNVVVDKKKVQAGAVSYQITGMKPFTDMKFATIGNDWRLPQTLLSDTDKAWVKSLIEVVGEKMRKESWRGLFGIDMIKDAASGKMYFIEVNARQPASTTFESALQESLRTTNENSANKTVAIGATTFEAHLLALLGEVIPVPVIQLTDGAQIVQRVTKDFRSVNEDVVGSLELAGYNVVSYPNNEENADLIRIQSKSGIISEHNILGDKGEEIAKTLYS